MLLTTYFLIPKMVTLLFELVTRIFVLNDRLETYAQEQPIGGCPRDWIEKRACAVRYSEFNAAL